MLDIRPLLQRLGLLERISGGAYLDRYFLTPQTHWGQLLLHHFKRGDEDDDPHDHRWDFWTLPLTAYVELVMDPETGLLRPRVVPAWRWSFRRYDHAHLVLGPAALMGRKLLHDWVAGQGRYGGPNRNAPGVTAGNLAARAPLFTLVWRTPQRRRSWGFWRSPKSPEEAVRAQEGGLVAGHRLWVPWQQYLAERGRL